MRKISFDQLPTLFVSDRLPFVLNPSTGEGLLYEFDLEDGLQLRFWDFRLSDGLELCNGKNEANQYFHLVFFLHAPGLKLVSDRRIQKNSIWDTVFFCSTSTQRIVIPSSATIQCLSMTFSKEWLDQNLSGGDHVIRSVLKNLIVNPDLFILECMNLADKRNVTELSAMATSEWVVSFYLKSSVLKIIGDFFLKMVR